MPYENYDELHKITDQIKFIANDTSEEEQEAMKMYTTAYGYTINSELRSGKVSKNTNDVVRVLDSLFAAIPPLDFAITLWRDMDIKLKNYIHQGYTSTTTTSDQLDGTYETAVCCQYQITVPPGSKILPIQMFSDARSEQEILLPRNSSFTCTGEDIKNNVIWIYLTYSSPESVDVKDTQMLNSIRADAQRNHTKIAAIVDYIQKIMATGELQHQMDEENQLFDDKIDIDDFVRNKVHSLSKDVQCTEKIMKLLR
jgi:hypothetical protein